MSDKAFTAIVFFWALACSAQPEKFAEIDTPSTASGYISYLLVNEVPFPGEFSYVSIEESKAAMVQILWVVHCRLRMIPKGYTQRNIANTRAESATDVITAPRQCQGFFRAADGSPAFASRVEIRINYLLSIANKGKKPGKFAELLNFAKNLSREYAKEVIGYADRFEKLKVINSINVTGRAYSWMTDKDYYSPGGNFVSIPDSLSGSLGGNRFYTLKKED